MSLLGEGAVAIWHDITAQGRDEFYAWHGKEHMPERVGIAGFFRGRRYVAIDADLEFFNLYEASSTQVLAGPAYQERLNTPTPWTQSTVREFRDVARSICGVAASFGQGQGALMATWRYDVAPASASGHIEAMSKRILPEIADHRSVAGAHLLVADTAVSQLDTAERKARGTENQIPEWILLVEGWGDVDPFVDLCGRVLNNDLLGEMGATGAAETGLYRLQLTVSNTDLPAKP